MNDTGLPTPPSAARPKVPLRSSIFVRLFLVVVGSGLLANFVTYSGVLHGSRPRSLDKLHDNARHYAELLGDDIGRGGLQRAKALAETYQLAFRLEGSGYDWSSEPGLPTFAELARQSNEPGRRPPPPPLWSRMFGGGPRGAHRRHAVVDIVTDRGPAKLAVFAPPGPEHGFDFNSLGAILVLLSMLTLGTYWLLRRALLPLGPMLDVVGALGRGDFEKRIDASGADEMSLLGRAIDDMAQKLRATLAAKDRLLVDVSHELRSPLTRARLALEFLPDHPKKSALAEDLAEMESMVSVILDEARLRGGEPALKIAEVDLKPLLQRLASRYARVVSTLTPGPAWAYADGTRVEMIVRNLVENAVKYAPESTSIDLGLQRDGDAWRITVRDHGPGIPPAELSRVFEPFYRVDQSRTRATGGFGLGLTLARRIAEAHRGSLRLELPEDGGVRAVCLLPANASP